MSECQVQTSFDNVKKSHEVFVIHRHLAVHNKQPTKRNMPEKQRLQVHDKGSLK